MHPDVEKRLSERFLTSVRTFARVCSDRGSAYALAGTAALNQVRGQRARVLHLAGQGVMPHAAQVQRQRGIHRLGVF